MGVIFKAGFLLIGVLAAMTLLALYSRGAVYAAVAFSATLTPTPTPFPRRDYDPPAPPDLVLPADTTPMDMADPEGYPRVVKLWGGYEESAGIDFYAQYHLIISDAFSKAQLDYLRGKNPALRVLYSGIGTYDTDDGPLGRQWVNAGEGTWQFECFLRGTAGQVLRVGEWGHGMFNMGDDVCTGAIADYLIAQFDPAMYDGVFFDRINQVIEPDILNGIDLNHDGIADNRDDVNEQYWQGTQRFLSQVQQRLDAALGREAIVIGNDAPLHYTSQLNGREYESNLRNIMDSGQDWMWFRYNYEQWMQASREPHLTMVMANPPLWMRTKYGLGATSNLRGIALDEAAACEQRMRFGLATALLEGGLYSFDFGDTWHGNAWWYDEFDGAGLGLGYLGQPLGDAYYAAGPLTTPNVVANPAFEEPGPLSWALYTQGTGQAALETVPVTDTRLAPLAARVAIAASSGADDVRLTQASLAVIDGQAYTFSFWGRAPSPHWQVRLKLHASGNLAALYGLNEAVELGTTWQQYWVSFVASANASDAVLSLGVGSKPAGEVWIDGVSLRAGTAPAVFRRDFEHGLVLANATSERQVVPLNGVYHKINGAQAPLVKILIDDKALASEGFEKHGGWGIADARLEDWGSTFNYAVTTTNPDGFMSKVVWRPQIDHAGQYTVSAWLAPHANCTDTVTYTVRHAGGTTPVAVSQVVSEPTWVSLGVYSFAIGMQNCVTLTNLTHARWVVADVVRFESAARYNDGAEVTSVTLEGQDGIILLGEPASPLVVMTKTASHLALYEGQVLTFTLAFAPTDAQTETMRVRVVDPNPAPSYLEVLAPTISGGAFYSESINGVIWEGELTPGAGAVSVTFQAQVTGSVPASGYLIANRAEMFDQSRPDGPPLQTAVAWIRVMKELHLEPKVFLPWVVKSYAGE